MLNDKVAVITGGAMGNGLGIAKVFLNVGAKVAILDYSNTLSKTLGVLNSSNVCGYKVDVRDSKMVNSCMENIYKKFGHIDIVVNNSGVCKLASFEQTDDQLRDYHIDINIKGAWNVAKGALAYMQSGSIINLSSVSGTLVANGGEVAYAMSKAALIGFTKGLAAELADRNIRVNAILPGYIMTDVASNMSSNNSESSTMLNNLASAIPLKRLGKIEDIGNLAAFLASDAASYITAQSFVIDGGATLPEIMKTQV